MRFKQTSNMLDSFFKIAYYVFIACVVVLGLLLFVSTIPIPGNIEMKIVQSGSMEPTIHTGSTVVIKSFDSYHEGDVITFYFNRADKTPTTHRIVRIENGVYVTKGDANENEDPRAIAQSSVVGKVLFSVPYLGFVLDFAKKPLGFALVIGVPAALIILDEVGKIWNEVRATRRKEEEEEKENV